MAYGASLLMTLGIVSLASSNLALSAMEPSPSGLWRHIGNVVEGMTLSRVRISQAPRLARSPSGLWRPFRKRVGHCVPPGFESLSRRHGRVA